MTHLDSLVPLADESFHVSVDAGSVLVMVSIDVLDRGHDLRGAAALQLSAEEAARLGRALLDASGTLQ